MTELFGVYTIVPEYSGRKDVCFNWFIEDRHGKPTVPYAEVVQDYEPSDFYVESFVEELFTEDEARQLISYLNATHPDGTQHLRPVELPIRSTIAGFGANAVGGTCDFYMLTDTPGYDLPFKVWGFFDLRFCEPTPGCEAWDFDQIQSDLITRPDRLN